MILSPGEEAALDWYFGEGQGLLFRSSLGTMLERAALYAQPYVLPDERPVVEARPTAETREPGGYNIDEGVLSRYARVQKRIQGVQHQDPHSVRVLSLYYGDIGARWGRTTHGRLLAVASETPCGVKLCERARRRTQAAPRATPDEQLGALLEVQRVQPEPARELLLRRAMHEALCDYVHACTLYRQTGERGTP